MLCRPTACAWDVFLPLLLYMHEVIVLCVKKMNWKGRYILESHKTQINLTSLHGMTGAYTPACTSASHFSHAPHPPPPCNKGHALFGYTVKCPEGSVVLTPVRDPQQAPITHTAV